MSLKNSSVKHYFINRQQKPDIEETNSPSFVSLTPPAPIASTTLPTNETTTPPAIEGTPSGNVTVQPKTPPSLKTSTPGATNTSPQEHISAPPTPKSGSGPKCLSGWVHFNGSCWQLFDQPLNWTNAKEHCNSLKGHLAAINGEAENEFVSTIIFKNKTASDKESIAA